VIALCHSPRRPAPVFEVIDGGLPRADLQRRKELKFTLHRADVRKLRVLLAGNGRQQVFNEPVSTVNSVYFDDANLSACRANLDGLGQRCKVRIRWYDSPQPGQSFFFEIKWRDNRVTGKHRLQIRAAERLSELSYSTIFASLSAALPEQCQRALVRYCEPTVLVRYQREHFAASDGSLRATIDYNITYFDQTSKRFVSTAFGVPHEGLVVLEGKTPVGREHELRSLVHPLGARVGRCSKYVYGCQLLGLIRT
jgi:VTC domain-containing protein